MVNSLFCFVPSQYISCNYTYIANHLYIYTSTILINFRPVLDAVTIPKYNILSTAMYITSFYPPSYNNLFRYSTRACLIATNYI